MSMQRYDEGMFGFVSSDDNGRYVLQEEAAMEIQVLQGALAGAEWQEDELKTALSDMQHRAEIAESSLAAMRQRADALEEHASLLQERCDAAIVRAKAAEFTAHTFSVACDAHKRHAEWAESILLDESMDHKAHGFCDCPLCKFAESITPPADASGLAHYETEASTDPYSGELGNINLRNLAARMHAALGLLKRQGCYHPFMDSMREEGFRHGLNINDREPEDHIGDATEMVGEAVSKKENADLRQKVRRLEEALRKAESWTDAIHRALAEYMRPKQSVGEMVYGLLDFIRAVLAEMEQKP